MLALKEKSDKELLQYNMELKELLRIIDHDRKLKEFMTIKGEDRAETFGLSKQYSLRREIRDKGGEKEDTIQVCIKESIMIYANESRKEKRNNITAGI